MKTTMSLGIVGVACYYPEATIAVVIAILFLLDTISKSIKAYSKDKGVTFYSSVKEMLLDENSEHYIPERQEISSSDISTAAVTSSDIHLDDADANSILANEERNSGVSINITNAAADFRQKEEEVERDATSSAPTTVMNIEKAIAIKEHQRAASLKNLCTESTDSIDVSTKSIEVSTKSIDECTKSIDVSTKSIDVSTESIDYKAMSYRDIQQLCRSAGIKRINRKRRVLIAALQSM